MGVNNMIYSIKQGREDYFPPLLGNGTINTALDCRGTHRPVPEGASACGPAVWWSGRRFGYPFNRPLIPFGAIGETVYSGAGAAGEPADETQELDPRAAVMRGECRWANGLTERTEARIHHDANALLLQKEFSAPVTLEWTLTLGCAPHRPTLPQPMVRAVQERENGLTARYAVSGQREYAGEVRLWADAPAQASRSGETLTLTVACAAGVPVHIFVLWTDDTEPAAADAAEALLAAGYGAAAARHTSAWAAYYAAAQVTLPDARLQSVFDTARYALKLNTTPWSIAVGMFDSAWEGKFFAFDEYYGLDGLLHAGAADLACHAADFRAAELPQAIHRATGGVGQTGEARYPWETTETFEEASPPGHWYEHVFHMANIALGQARVFEYTADADRLRRAAYPVMRACTRFFVRHMIYETPDGRTIIGACTDLERLGPSVRNPFMTTCAVIDTLRATARAAALLQTDGPEAAQWEALAHRLTAGLPVENGEYIAAPGVPQRSIAVFSGCYPYEVFRRADPRLMRAIDGYCENEHLFGNMYAMGHGISPWYAAWEAVTFARLGQRARAWHSLHSAAASVGCFDEIFEINEPGIHKQPWFMTAAGIFVTAVTESLLQTEGNRVKLGFGLPADASFAFTLPAKGGRTITAEVRSGRVVRLESSDGAPLEIVQPAESAADPCNSPQNVL